MKNLSKLSAVAALGVGVLVAGTMGASARIVCNADGDCWHVKVEHQYKPEFSLSVRPDDWAWKEGEKYRWREHEGRGYWRGENWVEF